ncbi:hypothetical protein HBI24_199470 [Parastagonospora nodorum]|nr:hypothetical protein HBI24_199470 [Parastagonospora nodorum]KAH6205274.1 hypothetical protein HBI43_195290 [Parastagonospora nodorum]KAH6249969.1 hypothetical protein HBI42_165110 [Parastagonospora nodorum]
MRRATLLAVMASALLAVFIQPAIASNSQQPTGTDGVLGSPLPEPSGHSECAAEAHQRLYSLASFARPGHSCGFAGTSNAAQKLLKYLREGPCESAVTVS